jgi:hypothetical protein
MFQNVCRFSSNLYPVLAAGWSNKGRNQREMYVLTTSLQTHDGVRTYFSDKTCLDIMIQRPKFMLPLQINFVCNNLQDLLGMMLKYTLNYKNEMRYLKNLLRT